MHFGWRHCAVEYLTETGAFSGTTWSKQQMDWIVILKKVKNGRALVHNLAWSGQFCELVGQGEEYCTEDISAPTKEHCHLLMAKCHSRAVTDLYQCRLELGKLTQSWLLLKPPKWAGIAWLGCILNPIRLITVVFTQHCHVTFSQTKNWSNGPTPITQQRTSVSLRKLHQTTRKSWPVVTCNNRAAHTEV